MGGEVVNANQKGRRFEKAVAEFLAAYGVEVERPGVLISGPDIRLPDHGVVIECKNHQRMALGEWVTKLDADQAAADRRADREATWVVAHKRARHPIEDTYVTLTLAAFADLLGLDPGDPQR